MFRTIRISMGFLLGMRLRDFENVHIFPLCRRVLLVSTLRDTNQVSCLEGRRPPLFRPAGCNRDEAQATMQAADTLI